MLYINKRHDVNYSEFVQDQGRYVRSTSVHMQASFQLKGMTLFNAKITKTNAYLLTLFVVTFPKVSQKQNATQH
jgi:hypothetical protein